jgi:heme exporter protein C
MARWHQWFQINKVTRIAEKSWLPTLLIGLISLFIGTIWAWHAPFDYQQGSTVRIMYIHVPSAWLSMFLYTSLALCSAAYIIWKNPTSILLAQSIAPIGAMFSLLTLATGSIWGKPMWGTWWVWDARLTSMLILFIFYLVYISLSKAYDNPIRAATVISIVALIGFINIPIVKFSVDFWNTLHQPASLLRTGGPRIHNSMLGPLLIMAFSCKFISYALISMGFIIKRRRLSQHVGRNL